MNCLFNNNYIVKQFIFDFEAHELFYFHTKYLMMHLLLIELGQRMITNFTRGLSKGHSPSRLQIASFPISRPTLLQLVLKIRTLLESFHPNKGER